MINQINKLLNLFKNTRNNSEFIKMQNYNSQIIQKQMILNYQYLKNQNLALPNFNDVGFRVFSQTNEDGILLYIFSLIGTTNKICFDIAFANPYGANTTNLILNHGWHGYLVCGVKKESESANNFFRRHPDSLIFPPKVINSWVTAENINEIISKMGISEEVDFLSLDMDGVDYWVWKNLEQISPRVVLVETNNLWGDKKSVTVPYAADFNRHNTHKDYLGASIPAFIKLAKEKGYRLVACNKLGFNLFFVKNGLAENLLPEIQAEDCYKNLSPDYIKNIQERFEKIKDFEWVEI